MITPLTNLDDYPLTRRSANEAAQVVADLSQFIAGLQEYAH
ncbi:MAG: hypothetical protein WCH98_02560 [Verrucomicrobiota bacterium]